MIKKAVIILPDQHKEPVTSEDVHPLVPIGGLTLIQRILYNLQWAGIEQGIILSYSDMLKVKAQTQADPKNHAFTWPAWYPPANNQQSAKEIMNILDDDFMLCSPRWIIDRRIIKDLGKGEELLTKGALIEPSGSSIPYAEELPPMALVPGKKCPELIEAINTKRPLEEIKKYLYKTPHETRQEIPDTALIRVGKNDDIAQAEDKLFQGLIKPTESFMTRKIQRKISMALTRKLLYTRITPNHISIGSILLGLISAVLFLSEYRALHVLGGLLLLSSSIIDGCDGELARLRFQESRLGSWLDFLGDNVVHIAVFLCLGIGLYLRGSGPVYILLGSMAALATFTAATSVFIRVFMKSGSSVITFSTPVRVEEMDQAKGSLRQRIDFVDKISNRDFIYLILFLAATGHLWIFTWVSAFGSTFYIFNLLYLYKRMAGISQSSPAASA